MIMFKLAFLVALIGMNANTSLAETRKLNEPFGSVVSRELATCLPYPDIDETSTVCFALVAGQSMIAGEVCVAVVAGSHDSIKLTYDTSGTTACLLETHAFMGGTYDKVPVGRDGNPKIGNFPYSSGAIGLKPCVTEYSFTIPISLACEKSYQMAAHASVYFIGGTQETAWSAGARINKRGSWATLSQVPTCQCPSEAPSMSPSISPTAIPSSAPSATPSLAPSAMPSFAPSATPSAAPSAKPSQAPSAMPSLAPSATPSAKPSLAPSATPSLTPSAIPSAKPSQAPSATPSLAPSVTPSATPSGTPSSFPSVAPSSVPSVLPSLTPSRFPSHLPSRVPSSFPSPAPTSKATITGTSGCGAAFSSEVGAGEMCFPMFAGQTIVVGEVCVTLQGNVANVVYALNDTDQSKACLKEVQADIDYNPTSNPGSFDYKEEFVAGQCTRTATFSIPLPSPACLNGAAFTESVKLAAHATVVNVVNKDGKVSQETAWSAGDPIGGGSWAMASFLPLKCEC